MANESSIWPSACEAIKRELKSDQAFNIWFGPIKFVGISDDVVTLEAPNRFFRDWLLGHYLNVLSSSLSGAVGKPIKVEFRLSENAEDHREVKEEPKPDDAHSPAKTDLSGGAKPDYAYSSAKTEPRIKSFWPFSREKQDLIKEAGFNPKYTFDNFVVGSSNRFVHAAALAVCDSPAKSYNPLFIYGGVGLGKTHILHAIGQSIIHRYPKSKLLYISGEEFTNQLITSIQTKATVKFREKYRNVDVILIDDIQFIAGKESTQEEFFHTFNALHDAHKQIVLSSDRPPKEIHTLEERLVTRFIWGLVADIQPPDFETRMAILKKKSEVETISVPDDVYLFLAENIKSNIRELEGALIRVVAYAKLEGRSITLEMAKDVLKDMISEGEKKVSVDAIQKRVCDYFDIRLSDMKVRRRTRGIAYPRQIAMYLSRRLTEYSLPEIGEFFGGRDHTTVLHAFDKVEGDIKNKKGLSDLIEKFIKDIKG